LINIYHKTSLVIGRGDEHLDRGARGNEHLGRGGRGDEQISLDFRNNHPHARFQERIVEKWVGWSAKDLTLKQQFKN